MASAAVLLAAACGGASKSSSSGSGGQNDGGGGRNEAFTAYIDCLAKNGVTMTLPSFGPRASRGPGAFPSGMPRPSGSGGPRGGGFPGGGMFQKPAGVDDATWTKAQAACASVRPTGRGGGGNGANQAYRNCLKQHGVTLDGNLSTTDPTVQKAMETCKVLRPTASATPSA